MSGGGGRGAEMDCMRGGLWGEGLHKNKRE
jgi:hypothetical protein